MSPWPFVCGVSGLCSVSSFVCWFKVGVVVPLFLGLGFLGMSMFCWWRDVSFEGVGGEYSSMVVDGLKLGMVLFILSEVWFFAAFFWCFFHGSLAPMVELGSVWPPVGVVVFNPFHVPLLNTAVLLSSGLTVTWSHHSLLCSKEGELSLFLTLVLGFYFTCLQGFEYYSAGFTICDSVYGSVFFIATGFHGLHVLIGSGFLAICLFRMLSWSFGSWNHLGYEMAIWYWHFVDVVWLFLFSCVYWWGA